MAPPEGHNGTLGNDRTGVGAPASQNTAPPAAERGAAVGPSTSAPSACPGERARARRDSYAEGHSGIGHTRQRAGPMEKPPNSKRVPTREPYSAVPRNEALIPAEPRVSRPRHAKRRQAITKGHVLCNSMHVTRAEQAKLRGRKGAWWLLSAGGILTGGEGFLSW